MPDELAWDTIDSAVEFSCPGFDIRRDGVRFPDGTEDDFHYLAEGDCVVVIPFTAAGDLVVIEEWRQAVDRVSRGFPAGRVEPEDADLAAAAHRELREETGYIADEVEYLTAAEPANGITDAVHHYFVARRCLENGTQDLDHNESIRVSLTTMDRLRDRVYGGEVRDGRTALGVFYHDALADGA